MTIQPVSPSHLEQRLLNEINRVRIDHGLSAWILSKDLTGLSRVHSAQMASGKKPFSHKDFAARSSAIRRRIGAGRIAENIARSSQDAALLAQATVQSWLDHKPHRINLLSPGRWAGIGIAQNSHGEHFITLLIASH